MRPGFVRAALVGVAGVVGIGAPSMCHAQWWWPPTNGSLMNPPCPAILAPVWLGVSGNFPDTCVPASVAISRNGNEFDLTFSSTTPAGGCQGILSPWAIVASLGPLTEGQYPVYTTYVRDGVPLTGRVLLRVITVSPQCPPSCYANCDRSSTAPYLNVNDFACFLQRYAAGDLYANCDGSAAAPAVNFGDFMCFMQRYADGCH